MLVSSGANPAEDDASSGSGLPPEFHVRHRLLDLLPCQAGSCARKNGSTRHSLPRFGKIRLTLFH